MPHNPQQTPSPCIRKCTLNAQDICLGCFRTLDEIVHWSQVDNKTRQVFIHNIAKRKAGAKPPPFKA